MPEPHQGDARRTEAFPDKSGIPFRAQLRPVIAAVDRIADFAHRPQNGIERGHQHPGCLGIMCRVQFKHIGQRALEIHRRTGEGLPKGLAEPGLEHDFPAVEDGIVRARGPPYGFFRGKAAAFQADAALVQMMPCDGITQCLLEAGIQDFFRHHGPYLRMVTGVFQPERRPQETPV